VPIYVIKDLWEHQDCRPDLSTLDVAAVLYRRADYHLRDIISDVNYETCRGLRAIGINCEDSHIQDFHILGDSNKRLVRRVKHYPRWQAMFAAVQLCGECQLIGLRVFEHLVPIKLKLHREPNYEDLICNRPNGVWTAIGNDQIESGGECVLLIGESLYLNLDVIEARGCRHPAKLLGGSRKGKGQWEGVA
jgi:hypothetical protein